MKHIYYEPKTGVVFAQEPRERNVYCIVDTPENREKLRKLEGTDKLTWLETEDQESRAGAHG